MKYIISDKNKLNKKFNIQMKFHGLYEKIDKISLINENGDELYNEDLSKLRTVPSHINNTSLTENVFNINVNKVPNNDTLYVKTSGKDSNGK